MTADNYRFYLQNRLFQTGQTGGPLYSDTSPFSVPCADSRNVVCCTVTCEILLGLRCSVGVTSQEFVTSYEDSVEVALMRKSGAIPICSTNATELGIWDQSYKTFLAVVEDHSTSFSS
jgi:hypothetical protein